MSVPILPKRRSADATAPTTANLIDGEVAINSFSKTIYQRVGSNIVPVANYFSGAWTDLTNRPTTRGGFGIVDVPKTDGTSATGNWSINITGSAAKLTTARTIALSGPLTGTATAFDGSANITIPVTSLDLSHAPVTGTLPFNRGGTGLTVAPVGTYLRSTGIGYETLTAEQVRQHINQKGFTHSDTEPVDKIPGDR